MKIGWNFPDNNNGSVNGISDAGIETFKGNIFQSLAREICQNSLDARKENNKPVKIEISLSDIDVENIPDYEKLQGVFKLSKSYWENNIKAVKFYKNGLNLLNSKKVKLLRISDFNTTGLIGSKANKNSDWINLVKSSGVSGKIGTAGGSYGIGKNAPFACSDLRIVYYSTLDKNGVRAYQGVAKLASFEEERYELKKKIITQGIGFYGNIKDNSPVFENFSLDNFQRNDSGKDIYILGFINDKNWKNEIIHSVLSSYLLSIYNENLEFKVDNILINKKNLSELIQEYDDKLTKEYYQVLCSPNTIHKEKNFVGLGNISLDILIEKDLITRRVLMARGNGMKVFDKNRISASMQFSGICVLKDKEVDKYFRLMESPQHDKWEPDRHPDRIKAKKIVKELSKFIKDEIKELGKNTILDEMDVVGANEYLPDRVLEKENIEENKRESLLNRTSNISTLKKIDVRTMDNKGSQIISEKDLSNSITDTNGEFNKNGNLCSKKKYNGENSKKTNFNIYDFFGIASDKNEVIVESPIKIEPLKYRLFLYNKTDKVYKLSFIPKITSSNSFIEIYLSGEQGRTSSVIKIAYDKNKKLLLYKKDKIYIGNLEANKKYTVFYSIYDEELCSMEVSIYGYNK